MIRLPTRGTSGVVFAIAAPLLYSALVPLSKVFLRQVDAWMLAGLLDMGAGLGMVVVYLLRRAVRREPVKDALRKEIGAGFGLLSLPVGCLGQFYRPMELLTVRQFLPLCCSIWKECSRG